DRLQVTHFVRNDSDMLWSGGLWGLTCTVPTPTTTYLVPLSNRSTWDTASMVLFKLWGGHAGAYDDPQFILTDDAVQIRSLGRENKRMFRAEAGLLALHDPARDVLFVKQAAYRRGAHYPMGCNLACYTGPDSFMVELETMSPFATLNPGETLEHVEYWQLSAAPAQAPTAARLISILTRPPDVRPLLRPHPGAGRLPRAFFRRPHAAHPLARPRQPHRGAHRLQ
ncbi:MAG: hypothetical protein ACHQ5A_01615, partial [Opitutales bacterium]